MSDLLTIYLIGCAFWGFIYGFRTRYRNCDDGPRAIVTVVGWPIILVVAAGQASRMFSPERNAQDIADGLHAKEPTP